MLTPDDRLWLENRVAPASHLLLGNSVLTLSGAAPPSGMLRLISTEFQSPFCYRHAASILIGSLQLASASEVGSLEDHEGQDQRLLRWFLSAASVRKLHVFKSGSSQDMRSSRCYTASKLHLSREHKETLLVWRSPRDLVMHFSSPRIHHGQLVALWAE